MTIRQATNLDQELCTCGHLRGEHGNTAAGFGMGHGRCLAPLRSATRCQCEKFTWAREPEGGYTFDAPCREA